MENKEIIYKNRIEVKILGIFYCIVFIPVSILLLIISFKDPEMLVLFLFIFFFLFILYIIKRFRIVFDYKNRKIYHTGYISKTRSYSFDDITAKKRRGNTTLPNDYKYFFYWKNDFIFKISAGDFTMQTKENIDYLNLFLSDYQKYLYEIKKNIIIKNGYIGIITYELNKEMAVIYLSNNINTYLGYSESDKKFNLTVYLNNDRSNYQEIIQIENIADVLISLQRLTDKYSELLN